jgi:hypothetical protein
MKQNNLGGAQLAGAILALAAMVFLVTFAMNYLGSGGERRPTVVRSTAGLGRKLTFRTLTAPERWILPGQGKNRNGSVLRLYDTVLECEGKKGGHQDFWFINDNEAPLNVGLADKNCSCSSVKLFLPPVAWQPLAHLLAAEAVGLPAEGTGLLPLVCARAAGSSVLESAAEGHDLLKGQESVTVPAGVVGWVRLGWKGDKTGGQQLSAQLWTERKEGGETVSLEARVLFHHALELDKDRNVGLVRDEELPHRETIKIWSATHPVLHLRAQAVTTRKPDADPFVVSEPEPLSMEELQELERENNSSGEGAMPRAPGRVLCAYRVHVTLLPLSKDGKTPFELGPFHRWLEISAPEEGISPIQVTIHGRVRGAVSVVNDEEGGGVHLGDFRQSLGKRTHIELQTDGADLDLKVDGERTPKYLTASLGDPQDVGSGRRLWTLHIEVKPNQARGKFPRLEDPVYRDSAVYLKSLQPGKPPRAIRIPVGGTAIEG